MKEASELSYFYGGNAPYLEDLYEQYLANPSGVDDYWKNQFDKLSRESGTIPKDQPRLRVEESFKEFSHIKNAQITSPHMDVQAMQKQIGVLRLVYSFRVLGSRFADLDVLQRNPQDIHHAEVLNIETYGLTTEDLSKKFSIVPNFSKNKQPITLSEILAKLKQTYCSKIGVEYMHIIDREERHWVRERFESELSTPTFDSATKKHILKKLTGAETFERYLSTKFVGQKRFSLEGGESLIPGLDYLINQSTTVGVQSIVIGMAHRGRLNVLINILGKSPQDLFDEFSDKAEINLPSGDVKYHNGFTSDIETDSGHVHLSLEFNPSHLEIVNPVVQGNVKARQKRRISDGKAQVLPILIHGDAAFSGLGVNQATFNLSQVRGYSTGGTIHIVVNNQIGFTTSDLRDVRSTTFCTDIAKMVDAPIIHVNGDDPEAMCYAIQVALDFRTKFHKDVVIDMVCYRRLGHNEGDDPFITQPMMYKKIANHPTTRTIYAEKLVKQGVVTEEEAKEMIESYRILLDEGKHVRQLKLGSYQHKYSQNWEIYKNVHWTQSIDTSLPVSEIQSLTKKFTHIPEGFQLHRSVAKLIEQRKKMGAGEIPLDWGMAETLAYASLVAQGHGVRISGEDSGRGTFSHRHAVLHDQNRERWDQGTYIPLQNISKDQAYFMVIDSILNEEAVLAFEYGYACSAPTQLVIWEAQFGDFANGAQVAIDQFISSGEAKWGRLCGLTVLLPHGYDGQGPEHSSGRMERWLQLCADDNMQIICLSETAQMFHVLRRQVLRPYRKPLVIFMSKRLLRFKESMSDIRDFSDGSSFRPVIGDSFSRDTAKVKRIILCTGQVYYDIKAEREKRRLEQEVVIIRLEQLYPFPSDDLVTALKPYSMVTDIKWVQEEPLNQGAWYQILHHLSEHIDNTQQLTVSARPANSSPAVGYKSLHIQQLNDLLNDALTL